MTQQIKSKLEVLVSVMDEFPEFRYLGDPILRTPAEEVSIDEGLEIGTKLGQLLIAYRKKVGYGRGLAAPQIGIGKRVFSTYIDDQIQIYINPEITHKSETTHFYRELCLSSGIIWGDVERPDSITMKWTDKNSEPQEQTFDGFMARLIQHEEDHLHGHVNVDIALPGTLEIVSSDPLEEKLRTQRM